MYFELKRYHNYTQKVFNFSDFENLWNRFLSLSEGNYILLGDAILNSSMDSILKKIKNRGSICLRVMSGEFKGDDFRITIKHFDD